MILRQYYSLYYVISVNIFLKSDSRTFNCPSAGHVGTWPWYSLYHGNTARSLATNAVPYRLTSRHGTNITIKQLPYPWSAGANTSKHLLATTACSGRTSLPAVAAIIVPHIHPTTTTCSVLRQSHLLKTFVWVPPSLWNISERANKFGGLIVLASHGIEASVNARMFWQ